MLDVCVLVLVVYMPPQNGLKMPLRHLLIILDCSLAVRVTLDRVMLDLWRSLLNNFNRPHSYHARVLLRSAATVVAWSRPVLHFLRPVLDNFNMPLRHLFWVLAGAGA